MQRAMNKRKQADNWDTFFQLLPLPYDGYDKKPQSSQGEGGLQISPEHGSSKAISPSLTRLNDQGPALIPNT